MATRREIVNDNDCCQTMYSCSVKNSRTHVVISGSVLIVIEGTANKSKSDCMNLLDLG